MEMNEDFKMCEGGQGRDAGDMHGDGAIMLGIFLVAVSSLIAIGGIYGLFLLTCRLL